jgi:hypothetical protein
MRQRVVRSECDERWWCIVCSKQAGGGEGLVQDKGGRRSECQPGAASETKTSAYTTKKCTHTLSLTSAHTRTLINHPLQMVSHAHRTVRHAHIHTLSFLLTRRSSRWLPRCSRGFTQEISCTGGRSAADVPQQRVPTGDGVRATECWVEGEEERMGRTPLWRMGTGNAHTAQP